MDSKTGAFKKPLRLSGFDYSSDNAYFITQNTDFNRYILKGEVKAAVEKTIYELPKRFSGLKINTFVVMPTHFHAIFFLVNSENSISKIMQAMKSISTISVKRTGYKFPRLWQPTFYERVIRNEKELYATRNYILNNPEKAHILQEIYSSQASLTTTKM